jgi:hypothetical protein
MDVNTHIGNKLQVINIDIGREWLLWEHKAFNIHRAVIHWDASKLKLTLSDIQKNVRDLIKRQFKVRFWRGFGFGTVVALAELPYDISAFEKSVDQRDNRQGTWQWIILIDNNSKKYLSNHTWAKGYLTPIYESILSNLESNGYATAT